MTQLNPGHRQLLEENRPSWKPFLRGLLVLAFLFLLGMVIGWSLNACRAQELPSVYDRPPLIVPGYVDAQAQIDEQIWYERHLYVWPTSATVCIGGYWNPVENVCQNVPYCPPHGCAPIAAAMPTPKPCSTHTRGFWNGHWLSSNMCKEDYERWVQPRLHDTWRRDGWFWAGAGVIVASNVADAWTTSARRRGLEESNPLLGRSPSDRKIAVVAGLGTGIELGLHLLAWKKSHNDPSRFWREFGRWSGPVAIALINGRAAIRNAQLNAK